MPPIRDFRRKSPSNFRAALGSQIAAIRTAAELKQRDVSARTGIRIDRLSKYETGEQPPPVFALWTIAGALGRPVDLFLPELHLPVASDQALYLRCRRLWSYPETVRALAAQILNAFSEIVEGGLEIREVRHVAPRR